MSINPKYLYRFHFSMTIIWALLIIPTIIFWPNSILWLALMSAWANFAAHFSAWQGARIEENENQ
jgi:hypothetical protein